MTVAKSKYERLVDRNKKLFALVNELADALRSLHDMQNGPPLWREEEKWKKAMAVAIELLRRTEK